MTTDLNNIQGKRILLIAQVFYDYHSKILTELEELGAEVMFVPNKFHGEDDVSVFDLIGNIRKMLKPLSKTAYARKILNSIHGQRFDYVFCIGGFSITPYLMSNISKLNPDIKKIIYFWDSFKTWNYSNLLNQFDSVFSFDPSDSANFKNVKYLPLFYTKDYTPDPTIRKDIDILYVGSISFLSKNRFVILKRVEEFAIENNLKCFIWLYHSESSRSMLGKVQSFLKGIIVPDFRCYRKLVRSKNISFLKTEVLKRNEIINLMQRAKSIIDIPIPNQLGLTIRTIETLALNDKLITTNPQIQSEPFYDCERIYLLDESRLNLDVEFIKKEESCKIEISHLELKNWLLAMF